MRYLITETQGCLQAHLHIFGASPPPFIYRGTSQTRHRRVFLLRSAAEGSGRCTTSFVHTDDDDDNDDNVDGCKCFSCCDRGPESQIVLLLWCRA